jgi:hemerythrin-like domain-containing protein
MDEKTLAEWMKKQAQHLQELGAGLREHIVSVPGASRVTWLAELARRFDHFVDHLHQILAAEEQQGYLTPVLEQRPSLSQQVELLRHEHDELRILADDLRRMVHSLRPEDHLLVRDTCTRIQIFLGHLQRHEEHENHIVLYTLTEDIGTAEGP